MFDKLSVFQVGSFGFTEHYGFVSHRNHFSRAFSFIDGVLVLAVGALVGGVAYASSLRIFERSEEQIAAIYEEAEQSLIGELTLSYEETVFSSGVSAEVLSPKVSGGVEERSFSVSGVLPPGVYFDEVSGAFTGPDVVFPVVVAADTSDGTCFVFSNGSSGCFGEGLAVESNHSCEVLDDGTVACRGDNRQGQLGNGSSSATSDVVLVAGLSGAVDVVVGSKHSCALLSNGTVQCWGANDVGQLGNGAKFNSTLPSPVRDLDGAVALSSGGGDHTCALHADGSVSCWGSGSAFGFDGAVRSARLVGGFGNAGFPASVAVTLVSGDVSVTEEVLLSVS